MTAVYQPSLYEAAVMPAHNGTATSAAAAAQAIPNVTPQKRIILEYLAGCGARGSTQDACVVATGLLINTCNPRFNAMADDHWIEPINETRLTRWKRRAVVYVITPRGLAALRDADPAGRLVAGETTTSVPD